MPLHDHVISPEGGEFRLRERVHGIDGQRSTFFQIDLEIIRMVWS